MNSSASDDTAISGSSPVNGLADVLSRRATFTIPEDVMTEWVGHSKPLWNILLLVTIIADEKMVDRSGEKKAPSANPLTSHEAITGTVRRLGTTTDLFLTEDALNMEIKITSQLGLLLGHFMQSQAVHATGEILTTQNVIAPIFNIWLSLWSQGSKIGYKAEWSSQANKPSPGRGDVDIAVECSLRGNITVEAAVLEAKNPQSCGHKDVENYGANGNGMVIGFQVMKHCIEAQKTMEPHWPEAARRPILAGLTVFPGHFFPSAYQDKDLVVFEDVIDIPGKSWPDTLNKLENTMRFTEVIAAWTLAVLINADAKFVTMWSGHCEEQVGRAEQFLLASGEQLATGHYFATLMWLWAAACIVLNQALTSCALSILNVRRFSSILLRDGQQLNVESSDLRVRFPVNFQLPHPDAYRESGNSKSYIFPRIVVKIVSDLVSYEREVAFYSNWTSLQGHGIPRLLASGRCFGSDLPFLVVSNEGEEVTVLTKEDQTMLEKTILRMIHDGGWHHHDLAPRNVVRDAAGRLCLIDFGEAGRFCVKRGLSDCDLYRPPIRISAVIRIPEKKIAWKENATPFSLLSSPTPSPSLSILHSGRNHTSKASSRIPLHRTSLDSAHSYCIDIQRVLRAVGWRSSLEGKAKSFMELRGNEILPQSSGTMLRGALLQSQPTPDLRPTTVRPFQAHKRTSNAPSGIIDYPKSFMQAFRSSSSLTEFCRRPDSKRASASPLTLT
ncbi:hypothetical protein NMY22_g8858 [Coprinellus aureogranulatus]|nr:hypothetical protein NMY22_g8858 [Coprinellus aureogranulatus]